MAGNKQVNSDLEILGKAIVSTVPNNTGTVLTYNAASKEISQRTNAEIIADLGLITATNIAAAYYTKTQLQTSGQAQVHWNNLTNIPTTFTPSVHNHDDRYYTEAESDTKYVPYTGATTDVNLNSRQLTNVNHLRLNQQTTTSTFLQLPNNSTSIGYADDQATYNLASYGSLFYQKGKLMMKVATMSSGNSSVFSNGFLGNLNSSTNTEYTSTTLLMNLYGLGHDSKGITNQSYNFNDNLKYNNTATALNIIGYQYGNKLTDVNNNASTTTFVGFHPEMYEGMHIGATNNYYNSEIYIDIRGQIFARKNRTYQGGTTANWNMFYSNDNSNKTTIDWNANTLNANIIKKVGGTASQFLKADGSVDSTVYAPASSLGNYLPLAGGTMSNNAPINWNAGTALIQYGGVNRFRLSSANTIISSVVTGITQGIFLRPQGDSVSTGQVTIDGNGQINTSSHGNSSQWNTAYGWGNHALAGYALSGSLGNYVPYTGATKAVNLNTQQLTLGGTFEKKSNVFEISHLGNDGYSTAEHLKRLTDVASLTLSSSPTVGDIIITIPIRTTTRWIMEVDIFSNSTIVEKLIISAYSTSQSLPQVSCLTDTEVISEVKFCRDANNNTVLILKRATGTSTFTYGKVNINDFYHAVSHHADLAVKSNYKVEFIDESTLNGITVNHIIKVDKVNFGTKNVDFTSGSISKTQNSVRHFRDVYQANSTSANTDKILSIKFPPQTAQSTMFRVEIDFYQYTNNLSTYTGKLIVSFQKSNNTNITTSSGLSSYWIGDKMLPTNIIKVGFDSSGNISINLGEPTTDWIGWFGFRVSSLESKNTGHNQDYSKGWTHEFISDETGYTGLVTVPLTISANQDWVNTQITNAGHSHSNKTFLDVINQNLGTTHTPTFNNITVGYVTGGFRGFSSNLPFAFLNAGQAQQIYTRGILASNSYADNTRIPTNGIYSKGNIVTGGTIEIQNDQSSNSASPLTLVRSSQVGLSFKIAGVDNFLGVDAGGVLRYGLNASHMTNYMIWHSGNFNPALYVTQTSLNTQLSNYATLAGNQTFTGTNTFNQSPVVPTPTLDTHAVNRKYITDNHYTKTEVDNLITSSNADKYITTISASQEVEHMLNTYDVSAEFYDIATMFTVGARVQRLTTNKIKVEFDTVPTNPIKVLIRKF